MQEMKGIAVNNVFLAFNMLQILKMNGGNILDSVQPAPGPALAPAKGVCRPVNIGRCGRQPRIYLSKYAFGAADQRTQILGRLSILQWAIAGKTYLIANL